MCIKVNVFVYAVYNLFISLSTLYKPVVYPTGITGTLLYITGKLPENILKALVAGLQGQDIKAVINRQL